MISSQRTFKRFNIYIVGEFSSLSRPEESFFGITRDFSCGGFSFESQAFDLEPGDVLEFRLKHPALDLTVSALGEIIWKRGADKFSCLLGVKFRKIADSAEDLMLKLMSAVSNIPVHAFLSSKDSGEVCNERHPAPENPTVHEETFDTIDTVTLAASEDEETEIESEFHYCGQSEFNGSAETGQKNVRPYVAVVLSITVVLLFTLAVPLEDNMTGMRRAESAFLQNLSQKEMYGTHSPSAVDGNTQVDGTVPGSPGSQSQAIANVTGSASETDKILKPEQSLSGIHESENREYFIQVGAWKNPAYAEEAHAKLMEYYPNAYMVMKSNFHVLRIPGVMTKAEGDTIAKEIQAAFKFNPLVVLKSE